MIKKAVETYKFDIVFDKYEYFETGKIDEIVEIIV